MRRTPSALALAVVALLLAGATACSGDDGDHRASTTSTTDTIAPDASSTSTTVDPALAPFLLAPEDLPTGFHAVTGIDDTITSFCAGQDAAAGLEASARSVVAYSRTPAGASVVQLVFRFKHDDAADFVRQAGVVLDGCSNVPDIKGLAFAYTPVSAGVDAALAGTDAHQARNGTSAGSGGLSEVVAVFHRGDVGQLLAVLAVDATPTDLDTLATAAFTAAVARSNASSPAG